PAVWTRRCCSRAPSPIRESARACTSNWMPGPASSETDASARFFDGKRAAPHDVTLGFADGRLIIRAVDGSLAVEWPVRSIVRRSEPNPERTVTLGQRRGPARLEIDDPG